MFGTDTTDRSSSRRRTILWLGIAVASGSIVVAAGTATRANADRTAPRVERMIAGPKLQLVRRGHRIQVRTISYTSHDGIRRSATLILPRWYGPSDNPPIPLVISPHGRNGTGRGNSAYWGNLPAVGGFAVVSPDGIGRRLRLNSFGYRGQIDDLARMPSLVTAALPWVRVDRGRIFALGSSMGGQETLLLVARHPRLLAGAAALDSVTDLARRYRQMPETQCTAACVRRFGQPYGFVLQKALAKEVGGTPTTDPRLYAERSPLRLAARIAASGVPLQIWWSTEDRIVTDQAHQSGALYRKLRRIDRCAPVSARFGTWVHSQEMRPGRLLPLALAGFGLLTDTSKAVRAAGTFLHAPECSSV